MPFEEIAMTVLCGMHEDTVPLLIYGNLFRTYMESPAKGDSLQERLLVQGPRQQADEVPRDLRPGMCRPERPGDDGVERSRVCRRMEQYMSTYPYVQRQNIEHIYRADKNLDGN